MSRDVHEYEGIMARVRPTSRRHAPMSAANRAAQFAPYAALVGFEDEVDAVFRRDELFADPVERVRFAPAP